MEELLKHCKFRLKQPLGDVRRKLVIIVNIAYVLLVVIFLGAEKISTGKFVPNPGLYFIYVPAFLINAFSAFINIRKSSLKNNIQENSGYWHKLLFNTKMDEILGWLSMLPIMIMSVLNMIGYGNPSSDAIMTDFALAHSLITGAIIILGRKGTVLWFAIVMAVLFWNVYSIGYNYEYHYLTPSEKVRYEQGLAQKSQWALERKVELEKAGLAPPKASRYFNTWFIFLIVAFLAAYYFSGITNDILKVVPPIVDDIEIAIEKSSKMKLELEEIQLERDKKYLEAEQNKFMLQQQLDETTKAAIKLAAAYEMIEKLNNELDKLEIIDKKKLAGIKKELKKAVDIEESWELFEININSSHNNFFKYLQSNYTQLTQNELKHLAYIKMNLSHDDIANLMGIDKESLRTSRYRIKSKLGLVNKSSLHEFVADIDQASINQVV